MRVRDSQEWSGTRCRAGILLVGAVTLLGVSFASDFIRRLPDQTVAQRETLELVHQLFPDPVPYIDRSSMVASYPKVGFFMTTWGMEGYRQAGQRIMRDLVTSKEPRFLIANTAALNISKPQTLEENESTYRLFEGDFDVLRQNYLHHWGWIFVAGKSFEFDSQGAEEGFEIIISGEYTLESLAPVLLDGTIVRPGDQVKLDQGEHRIASVDATPRAMLRWGRNLYKPDRAPSHQPIFYGF